MAEYAAILWNVFAETQPAAVAALKHYAAANGWRERVSIPGLIVLTGGAGEIEVHRPPHGRLIVLGTWTSDRSLLDATARDISPLGLCRRLTDTGWGRYVALCVNQQGEIDGVYRDPSGALDCAIWPASEATIITSAAPAWLIAALSGDWRPDWQRVADMVMDPTLVSGPSLLRGVEAVTPGDFQPLPLAGNPAIAIWRPTDFIAGPQLPMAEARQQLARAIDGVVATYVGRSERSLVEVSGGLDSAIVAAALHAADPRGPQTLVNYFGPYAEADERAYAKAVADLIGRPLTAIARPAPTDVAQGWIHDRLSLRPGFNRLDPVYDGAQARLCADLSCRLIMTGKGGDAVLFQPNTPVVFADVIRIRGLAALTDARLFEVARWTRQSIWSVFDTSWSALRSERRLVETAGRTASPFVAPELRSERVHPWLTGLQGVSPAKRIQIAAIAGNLSLHGPSLQTDVAAVFHPLLTQPVLEQALAIAAIDLVEGGRDRGLARSAFAGRIPDAIRFRRTKGGLSQYFGQAIAHDLEALRPFLLDGLLAGHSLLDRSALEAALSPDALIWKGGYGDIMLLVMTEAWARRWDSASVGV